MAREGTTQDLARGLRVGAAALALLGAGLLAGGCYERVTRAEGFGADRISTEAPNRTQGPIDQLIFGKDQQPVRNQ